jgi:hypothetical protein
MKIISYYEELKIYLYYTWAVTKEGYEKLNSTVIAENKFLALWH